MKANPDGPRWSLNAIGARLRAPGRSEAGALLFVVFAAVSSGQTVTVFSDLGANGSFSSNVWCVSGANNPNCGPSVTRYIAAPFTPTSTVDLLNITVAVSYNTGTNGVVISLANNASGVPGTVLESWSVSNLSASSQPPLTTVVSRLNPTLQAGQTYWVELQGIAADTLDVWYTNDLSLGGGLTNIGNAGWTALTGYGGQTLPAFAVNQTSCTPTKLIPTLTGLVSNAQLPVGFPTPLEVTLTDDCDNPINNGQVLATFSNRDGELVLDFMGNGQYDVTWTPVHASAQVIVQFVATAPGFSSATTSITVTVTANSVPTINTGGVVDSASYSTKPLSPGGIFSIFGTNLAVSTSQAGTLPLPTSLAGTSVIAGGIQAPIFFVSPTQINAMLPYELAPNTSYEIIVESGGAFTSPVAINTADVDPGILAYGQNQVIAVDVNGHLIGTSNPAHPGDALTMYCLGLGAVTQPVADGAAAPSNPPANTVNPVTVEVGTQTASVFFAGLTPTLAGLYQIDFFVPQGTPAGDQVPVTLSLGGQTSAAANLSVAIAQQCTPTKLVITPSNLTFSGSSLTSGLPIALNVSVADDCGNAVNNAQVVATFSNGDSPVVLSSVQNGKYAGTWQPKNVQSQTQVTVQFSAQTASLSSTAVNPAVQ